MLEQKFAAGTVITPELLISSGVVREIYHGLKVLGDGEVTKNFTVHAHKFSQSAQDKLVEAGGSVEILAAIRRRPEAK